MYLIKQKGKIKYKRNIKKYLAISLFFVYFMLIEIYLSKKLHSVKVSGFLNESAKQNPKEVYFATTNINNPE